MNMILPASMASRVKRPMVSLSGPSGQRGNLEDFVSGVHSFGIHISQLYFSRAPVLAVYQPSLPHLLYFSCSDYPLLAMPPIRGPLKLGYSPSVGSRSG